MATSHCLYASFLYHRLCGTATSSFPVAATFPRHLVFAFQIPHQAPQRSLIFAVILALPEIPCAETPPLTPHSSPSPHHPIKSGKSTGRFCLRSFEYAGREVSILTGGPRHSVARLSLEPLSWVPLFFGAVGCSRRPSRGRKAPDSRARNKLLVGEPHLAAICYDSAMRKMAIPSLGIALCALSLGSGARAQKDAGAIEIMARITPTGARPEPVRQFTFYILTKSYSEIVKEVEEKDPIPARDQFIDGLKVSPELRAWLKGHDTLDLTEPDLDKLLTPDDVLNVPEFLLAYQRSNSGGVTNGLPKPKYTEADKTEHPEKYDKLKQDYLFSLKKFIRSRPETVSGVELELDGVNPLRKWATLQNDRRKRVQRVAPDVAQLKFLAAKADTDLEGRASLSSVAPGDYWISSLNLDADAGDMRVRWDVPVKINAAKPSASNCRI